jgi:hypothetical protein
MWNMIRKAIVSILLFTGCALAADVSGEYVGTFASADGTTTGKIRTVLKKNPDATWDCKFFFNRTGEEVATKTVSCAVDEKKLTSEYTVDVDGDSIKIVIEGSFADDHGMDGSYKAVSASSGETVDQGKWKASLSQ